MSPDADRIAVPTNGRAPHPAGPAAPAGPGGPAATPPGTAATPSPAPSGVPSEADLATAFSPKQVAVGFGIVASLVLLAAGWARRRRSGG